MGLTSFPPQARLQIFSATAALILTLFYFAPLNMLLLNAREISISPFSLLLLSWPVQLVICLIALAVAALTSLATRQIAASVVISVALLLYLQGNYLVWDYGLFDGSDIDWAAHEFHGIFELLLWLGLPVLAICYRRRVLPHIHLVACLIVLVQLVALAVQLLSGSSFPDSETFDREDNPAEKILDSGLYEFSKDKNVLLILADTFGSPVFDLILGEDNELTESLTGFTYYRNTLGISPYTLLSIPTILSSVVYDNSITIQSFMTQSFGSNSLPAVLRDNGYKTHVVSMGLYKKYLQWLPAQGVGSLMDKKAEDIQLRAGLRVWDVTLFRYLPHALKRKIYNEHKWFLQEIYFGQERVSEVGGTKGWLKRAIPMMAPTSAHRSSVAMRDHFVNHASIESDSPTFKFMHTFTCHTPYLMSEDGRPLSQSQYKEISTPKRATAQCIYALQQIIDMLDKLRKLDIYDQTMIILLADHGADSMDHQVPNYLSRALPILLIKPFNTVGPLKFSDAPASLVDIPLTVVSALGIEAKFSGYSVLDEFKPSDRARYYYDYKWDDGFWSADYLTLIEKYRVSGMADDQSSWSDPVALTREQ